MGYIVPQTVIIILSCSSSSAPQTTTGLFSTNNIFDFNLVWRMDDFSLDVRCERTILLLSTCQALDSRLIYTNSTVLEPRTCTTIIVFDFWPRVCPGAVSESKTCWRQRQFIFSQYLATTTVVQGWFFPVCSMLTRVSTRRRLFSLYQRNWVFRQLETSITYY